MNKNKDTISPVEEEKEIKTDVTPVQENTQNNTSKKTKKEVTKKVAKANKEPKEDKKSKAPKEDKTTSTLVPEVFIQFASNELAVNPALDKVKAEWVAAGHKENSIKTLNLYVKPEENTAYYVINEKQTGKVDL